jgi:DMSO/TMAO reductase YedYZ molybdopterin-dependent catalytic subunit
VKQKLGHTSITLLFIGGLAAGAIAIAVSLLLRLFFGAPFIPELASQTLFSLTPGEIESQAVETFGSIAKYSAFIGAIIVNLILYGVIGVFLGRLRNKLHWNGYIRNALQSLLLSYIILLAVTILLLTLTEGQTNLISIPFLVIYLIPPHVAFGFTLSFFFYERIVIARPSSTVITKEKVSDHKTEIDYKKRLLLRAGIASAVALPILYFGLDNILSPKQAVQQQSPSLLLSQLQKSKSKPLGFEDPRLSPLLESEITPTDLFYRIDKNAIVPVVNAQAWKLTLKGLVDKPLEINYKELKDMPSIEQFATLECVSNKIGGDLISTAVWKGVRLKHVLGKAQVKPSAKYIVFRCSDGYDVGIPLDIGLLDGTILAYDMNGAALTSEHGYPVRAIVPGIYGMMNAKWLTEIELVDNVYEGYWQRKGWTNKAKYNTHSFIVIPDNASIRKRFRNLEPSNMTLNGRVPVAGVAFAGDRGISKVEVSTDGGTNWKDARIKDPLSQYTWVLWTAELDLIDKGNYKVMARTTDKTGKVQTPELQNPFPNGATGYHIVDI